MSLNRTYAVRKKVPKIRGAGDARPPLFSGYFHILRNFCKKAERLENNQPLCS